jgi:hypothetical protein
MSATAGIKAVMMNAVYTGGVSNWQTPGYIRGNVRVMIDYYIGVGSGEDAGSTIKFFPTLEAGMVVLGFIAYASTTTASLTFNLGDLDSATRYASASTAWAAAGSTLISSIWASATTGPYVIGTNPITAGVWSPTATDTDAQILVTTAGASLTSAGVYGLIMLYTID